MWRQRASEARPPTLSVTAIPGLDADPEHLDGRQFCGLFMDRAQSAGDPRHLDQGRRQRGSATAHRDSSRREPTGVVSGWPRDRVSSRGSGGFRRLRAGRNPAPIARSGSMVRWTPDGRSIVIGTTPAALPKGSLKFRSRHRPPLAGDASAEWYRRLIVRYLARRQNTRVRSLRAARRRRSVYRPHRRGRGSATS